MNIKTLAKEWLIDHKYYESAPSFKSDIDSLSALIWKALSHEGHIGEEPEYDKNFGDYVQCLCGHPYYRHFDSYSNMDPVGCKYCYKIYDEHDRQYGDSHCAGFKKAPPHKSDCTCSNCIES